MTGTMRAVLVYDPGIANPNTWRILDSRKGIRARFRLASGTEHVLDIDLRWKSTKGLYNDNRAHVHPIDGAQTTWLTEVSTFDGQLDIRISLQLNGATETAIEHLRNM